MTKSKTDAIHKQLVLKAPPSRVWQAISNAEQFGTWFGAKLRGELVAGHTVEGTVSYQGKELTMTLAIDRVEPERVVAFRWHPYAVDPAADYSQEPTTLVELAIAPAPEGTLLTITESGFDQIPEARRARAFEMNSGGWAEQLQNIARHVSA
jgi:uncharacterized protein YndB with AHSA1/START domain